MISLAYDDDRCYVHRSKEEQIIVDGSRRRAQRTEQLVGQVGRQSEHHDDDSPTQAVPDWQLIAMFNENFG